MQDNVKCIICGFVASVARTPSKTLVVDCQRCGRFEADLDSNSSNPLPGNFKGIAYVSGWLRENQGVKIDLNLIRKLISNKPINIYEKAYKLLKWLNDQIPSLGMRIEVEKIYSSPSLLAICWAFDSKELNYLVEYLVSENYIVEERRRIIIKPKGYAHLDEFNKNHNSNLCFCAMSFDEKLLPAWEMAIEPAIKNAGYEPKRVDKHPHNDGVVDEIISLIRRSRFVISDLTNHRNGVYFEAGFAKGLGINVIFTCKESDLENTHFDVKHFNVLLWSPEKYDDFSEKLKYRIEGTLGRGKNDQLS